MTESLDGGDVTYRSNRHFDILNENLIFDLQIRRHRERLPQRLRRRAARLTARALVLLNNDSHDEQSYADPFEALIRYMACSAIDGAPMIFYGEELGISTYFRLRQLPVEFRQDDPAVHGLQLPPADLQSGQPQLRRGLPLAGLCRHQPGARTSAPPCAVPTAITSTRPAAKPRSPASSPSPNTQQRQRLAEFLRRGLRLRQPRPQQPADRAVST